MNLKKLLIWNNKKFNIIILASAMCILFTGCLGTNNLEKNSERPSFVVSVATSDSNNDSVTNSYEDSDYSISHQTLTSFLKTAIKPMGSTLYVWGGGWNDEDTGAGIEAMSFGLSPRWEEYYKEQGPSYDFEQHRYEIHNGLDCSGYIGWAVYNTFGDKYSQNGYVNKASLIASSLSEMGLGEYLPAGTHDFKAGDICSMERHIWICLGTCYDGSALVLHASPPGVRLCGTTLSDGSNSEAIELAKSLMATYYSEWHGYFPNCFSSYLFISSASNLRWYDEVLPDVDDLKNKTAYEIADILFKN